MVTSIFNCDFREGIAKMKGESVDLVLTDPPYGTTNITWDTKINLQEFWDLIYSVLKPNGIVVSFAAQPFTTDLINSNRKHFRYELIWHKTAPVGFLDAKVRPLRDHENIVVFAPKLKASTYNPQMTVGTPYKTKAANGKKAVHYNVKTINPNPVDNPGTRYPRSVMTFNNRASGNFHPTQKPLDLVERLVRTYSNEGDLVLDPFTGSGTTIVAAANNNRQAIGFELNPEYCEKARQRVLDHSTNPTQPTLVRDFI